MKIGVSGAGVSAPFLYQNLLELICLPSSDADVVGSIPT